MARSYARSRSLGRGLALLVALGAAFGCSVVDRAPQPAKSSERTVEIELSTAYQAAYPCTQCHEHTPGSANPTERALTKFHGRIKLEHGNFGGWCYRCHSDKDPNMLHLPDGTELPFAKSYELCSGCHGDKGKQWKEGIHGLNTGYWNGATKRRACTLCHNPHKPRFQPMTPEPPPERPRTLNAHEAANKSKSHE